MARRGLLILALVGVAVCSSGCCMILTRAMWVHDDMVPGAATVCSHPETYRDAKNPFIIYAKLANGQVLKFETGVCGATQPPPVAEPSVTYGLRINDYRKVSPEQRIYYGPYRPFDLVDWSSCDRIDEREKSLFVSRFEPFSTKYYYHAVSPRDLLPEQAIPARDVPVSTVTMVEWVPHPQRPGETALKVLATPVMVVADVVWYSVYVVPATIVIFGGWACSSSRL